MIRVTPQRISQLMAAGLPVRADGLIDSGVGREWFAKRKRKVKRGRPPKPKMPEDVESNGKGETEEAFLPFEESAEEADYAKARAERERAQAGIKNLEWRKLEGELLERVQVERAAADTGRQIRDAVLAIPDRLSAILAAETSAAAIHEELTRELELALLTVANAITS